MAITSLSETSLNIQESSVSERAILQPGQFVFSYHCGVYSELPLPSCVFLNIVALNSFY